MKAGELMELLSQVHPDEQVYLRIEGNGRNYHIAGVNEQLTQANGCLTISIEPNADNKQVESVRDVLERQKKAIEEALDSIDDKQYRKARRTVNKKIKKNRTKEEQLAMGFIPTGKRGRPRKMRTEQDLINEGYQNEQAPAPEKTRIVTPQGKEQTYEG